MFEACSKICSETGLHFTVPRGEPSLLAKIKVLDVLPAHIPLVLDAGTVLVSVSPLICTGFVYCHCTGRWPVLDNTHDKESCAFR